MQHQKLLLLVGQTETKMEEIMDLMIVIAIPFATDPTDLMEMDLMDQMEMDQMEMDQMEMDQMEMDQMEMDPMGRAARSHVNPVSQ